MRKYMGKFSSMIFSSLLVRVTSLTPLSPTLRGSRRRLSLRPLQGSVYDLFDLDVGTTKKMLPFGEMSSPEAIKRAARNPGTVSGCFFVEAFPSTNEDHRGEEGRVVAVSDELLELFGGVDGGGGEDFVKFFTGQKRIPNIMPHNTVYGCHCGTQWFGQLGDGRAATILEVKDAKNDDHHEFQLKGCGQSLFSRGFDGRATLRGSIREMLGSEGLHFLGVPSQRGFAVIDTGDFINRPWYKEGEKGGSSKFPPNRMVKEREAVLTRVAYQSSFLRLGHIELAWRREETESIIKMVKFAIETTTAMEHLRNFEGSDDQLVLNFYETVVKLNVELVVEWLRVGYTQGNMNNDNLR